MKKRILALLMAIMMLAFLAACGSDNGGGTTDPDEGDDNQDKPEVLDTIGIAKEDLKIGLVLIGDEADSYSNNHIIGMDYAMETLGIPAGNLVTKNNVSESADCKDAILELVEAGCHIIFSNSFGHEQYMVEVAPDYPDIQFCAATGYQGAIDNLDNTHNYFTKIYEARYLAGIAAGMQTETNKLGYVAALDYAEVISGYTAFYLGAKSVNPDVEMYVNYTYEWSDPGKEATNAQALIDMGCDVISQHSDTTTPATTAQNAGVWAVGYNEDMIPVAKEAALVSARINWGIYYEYALEAMMNGAAIDQDWCEGLAEGAVYLSPLNYDIIKDGTEEAIELAKAGLLDGSIHVFDGPLYDVEGNVVVEEGEFYNENETASAPSWAFIIEGVNVLS